jgi:hypothetical protein
MISKITGGETALIFTAKLLSKYDVRFYRCKETGFIQTEEPYWLPESYSSAITKLDVGLVMRNQNLTEVAVPLFLRYFNHGSLFLDYAGGYGLFTRMMRDRGFNFYHTDIYCQNLFAEFHDLKELNKNTKFEAVTAFEVLEHLVSPKDEIKDILAYSDNLYFTTELVPPGLKKPDDWWYFSLETGQHISFYTKESLEYIAKQFDKFYYTDGKWQHLFTKTQLSENPFEALSAKKREHFFIRKMRKFLRRYDERKNLLPKKESLLEADWKEAKKRLSK